jgi:hypothetical protein
MFRPVLALVVSFGLVGAPSTVSAGSAETYSAPLVEAVADLPVGAEVRTGYDREKFKHWVDDDHDRCTTRFEVLIAEADDEPEVDEDCKFTGGRWFSYYDRVSWDSISKLDIDHVVSLAEAWDSGARLWTAEAREDYANDLDDVRTLVGVTARVNKSKGDRDVAEWLPEFGKCRFLREVVAVKLRWRLKVDAAEKAAMTALAQDCPAATVKVTRAR